MDTSENISSSGQYAPSSRLSVSSPGLMVRTSIEAPEPSSPSSNTVGIDSPTKYSSTRLGHTRAETYSHKSLVSQIFELADETDTFRKSTPTSQDDLSHILNNHNRHKQSSSLYRDDSEYVLVEPRSRQVYNAGNDLKNDLTHDIMSELSNSRPTSPIQKDLFLPSAPRLQHQTTSVRRIRTGFNAPDGTNASNCQASTQIQSIDINDPRSIQSMDLRRESIVSSTSAVVAQNGPSISSNNNINNIHIITNTDNVINNSIINNGSNHVNNISNPAISGNLANSSINGPLSHIIIKNNNGIRSSQDTLSAGFRDTFSLLPISFTQRIFPNLGLLFIISIIWILLLFYGEYAYPHSHAQYCKSSLSRESLFSRIVIISNPQLSQLPHHQGLFSFYDDIKTMFKSFLADFNLRRSFKIIHDKCSPEAVVFTGTMIENQASEQRSDSPSMVIDAEEYMRLLQRWKWIFPNRPSTRFLYAPSNTDVKYDIPRNKQRSSQSTNSVYSKDLPLSKNGENPLEESDSTLPLKREARLTEKNMLYHRFVDYFGPLNWKYDFGPIKLVSLFTPLVLPVQSSSHLNLQSNSFEDAIFKETKSFLTDIEHDLSNKNSSSLHSPLVLISPVPFYPLDDIACIDRDKSIFNVSMKLRSQSLPRSVSTELLSRLKPMSIVSNGVNTIEGIDMTNRLVHRAKTVNEELFHTKPSRFYNPATASITSTNNGLLKCQYLDSDHLMYLQQPKNAKFVNQSFTRLHKDSSSIHSLVHSVTNTTETILSSTSYLSGSKIPPGVLVLELRNSSLCSPGSSEALEFGNWIAQRHGEYQINTIFYDTTTYTDMSGSYFCALFLTAIGCMLSVSCAAAGGSNLSNLELPTSSLIETILSSSSCIFGSIGTFIQRLAITLHCNPALLCIPIDLERGVENLNIQPKVVFCKTIRIIALRIQITVELFLICSVLIVPWCFLVMLHWM